MILLHKPVLTWTVDQQYHSTEFTLYNYFTTSITDNSIVTDLNVVSTKLDSG